MHRTLYVWLSGNICYPKVAIERDGVKHQYGPGEYDLKRLQELISNHPGRIYIDLENSRIEIYSSK